MCSEQSSVKDIQYYNVKSEEIRRQKFYNWPVEFIDKNHLAAAGFCYTDWKDVVCCEFSKVQLSQWKKDDPFREHERWSASFKFIKGLFVGNIPVGSNNEKSTRSRDVCGSSSCKYHCLYLFFYMFVFLIALLTNYQCVLYSWTSKRIQTETQWVV